MISRTKGGSEALLLLNPSNGLRKTPNLPTLVVLGLDVHGEHIRRMADVENDILPVEMALGTYVVVEAERPQKLRVSGQVELRHVEIF